MNASEALLDAAADVIPGGVNTCRRRSDPRLCFRVAQAPTSRTSTAGATSTTTPPTERSSWGTRTRRSSSACRGAIERHRAVRRRRDRGRGRARTKLIAARAVGRAGRRLQQRI